MVPKGEAMGLKKRIALFILTIILAQGVWAQVPDVDVIITSDNAYSFGWGPLSSMTSFFGDIFNYTAGDIFNCSSGPETYLVSGANAVDFLYICAWSDDTHTQGVLGQFTAVGGPTVYTGEGEWEVYATGLDFDNSPGPTLAEINAQISIANTASGTPGLTSVGWVGTTPIAGREGVLEYGEDNTTPLDNGTPTCANPFNIVCATSSGHPHAIDDEARWMWYKRPGSTCAFIEGNQREFLIFRLRASSVATETSSWSRVKTLYR